MKFPGGSRHMKTLTFLILSTMLLLSSSIYKMHMDSRAKRIVASTRKVLSVINSKLGDFISENSTTLPPSKLLVYPSLQSEKNFPVRKETFPEKGAILIDRWVAEKVSKKIKLLCWIPTRQIYAETRMKAVNTTWALRCDKTIYFITNPKNKSHDVIALDIHDARRTLTDKTVFAHKFIYKHYMKDYDWFLKADDDTYVIVENLKFLLSHFNLTTPGYIGCQFKHFAPQGYMSGGAGYLFNARGIKDLVEKGYSIPGRCRLKGGAEDIETGRCAYKAGIPTLNQLDVHGKQTFFPSNVYANARGPIPEWAKGYARASVTAGLSCCSPLLVSFHYSGPKLIYILEFLLYRVVIHGRQEIIEQANAMFNGSLAKDMGRKMKRRPYPGEKLIEYYEKGWRKKNTTIYTNPRL